MDSAVRSTSVSVGSGSEEPQHPSWRKSGRASAASLDDASADRAIERCDDRFWLMVGD
jgi:hypothetical protein